jgi:hypothetical protein
MYTTGDTEMAKTFNPPPSWPQPPRNWSPPPDWQPDPAWGPAPPGWQLWIDESSPAAPAQKQPKEKRIFISYRRGDCQPQANAINDGLRHRIQPAHIFMDIDSIPPGVDFEEHVRDEIEICDVVLVLIGDDWLSATTYEGTRRLDDPDDFVRLEIESALGAARVSLVPVLVEGAAMPRPAELPESIRPMARINAIELSDQRWSSDIERLANVIRELEAQQEARAERRPGTQASTGLDTGLPAAPTMKMTDVEPRSLQSVIAVMSVEFRTKDLSDHPHVRAAHGALADSSNYDAIIGRYLSLYHAELQLGPPGTSDARGALWRRVAAAPPAPTPIYGPPTPMAPVHQQPAYHASVPQTFAPNTRTGQMHWVLVALPILTCGFLSFVPSVWVAVTHRSDSRAVVRALVTAAVFFAVMVVGFAMVGTAPTDADGSPTGAASNIGIGILFASGVVATVLAIFQRDPSPRA